MNKLQCPLCRQPFNQPSMCPHCSQVYCYQCIRNYLNLYYFCPSCDHHVIDLVDCSRLINEVKQKIKQSDLKKNSQKSISQASLCSQHNLPLKYHCITCKIDICSDCGLISHKHKTHSIQPIEMIKPSKNVVSSSQLKQIKLKISQKLFSAKEDHKKYQLELQLLKSQIKYNKTKIYEYYEQLILRLEKQAQVLLKEIETRIYQCAKNINQKAIVKQKLQNAQKSLYSSLSLSKIKNQIQSPIQKLKIKQKMIQSQLSGQQQKQQSQVQITDKQLYKYLLDNNYILPNAQSVKQKKVRGASKKLKSYLNLQIGEKKQQKRLGQMQYQRQEKQQHKRQEERQRQRPERKQYQRGEKISRKSEQESSSYSHSSLIFDKKIYELGIMKQIYPDYSNFSFQLDYILQKDQDIVYSSNFKVFGYEWRLKIYPQGNAQAFAEYISVFLQLINSLVLDSQPTEIILFSPLASKLKSCRQFCIQTHSLGKSVIKEYNSKFSVGQCWGYAQFIPLRQINDYLHDGKLLFVMGIKNISYFDLCQNMKKYVNKLEGQNKILSQLCEGYYVGASNIVQTTVNQNNSNSNNNIQILSVNSSTSSLSQRTVEINVQTNRNSNAININNARNLNYNDHNNNNINDIHLGDVVNNNRNRNNQNLLSILMRNQQNNSNNRMYIGVDDDISSIISSLDDDEV